MDKRERAKLFHTYANKRSKAAGDLEWVANYPRYQVVLLSGVFGIALLASVTLGHDGGAKAVSEIVGEFVELRITVNLDRLLGGVADDIAVMAPRKMIFQFGLGTVIYDAVEIIR